jgi:hypothetical protein
MNDTEAPDPVVGTERFTCYGRFIVREGTFMVPDARIHVEPEAAVLVVRQSGTALVVCPRCGLYPADQEVPDALWDEEAVHDAAYDYLDEAAWPPRVKSAAARDITVTRVVLGRVGPAWAYYVEGTATVPGTWFRAPDTATWWLVLDARTLAPLPVEHVRLPPPALQGR